MRALLEAVKNARGEDIDIGKKVEMIPEKSPVAEPRANGEGERYVHTVHRQLRTLQMALETRYNMKFNQSHHILPWLIMCAAMLINVWSAGDGGNTAYERR